MMNLQTSFPVTQSIHKPFKKGLVIDVPIKDFRTLPIPGVDSNAKVGLCYISILDLPETLDAFLELNPRIPSRNKKGSLSGPVVKGIMHTLKESPQMMVLKNQGIYLLVDNMEFSKREGELGTLKLSLSDPKSNGIINGGHTYSAIREAIESSTEEELQVLQDAYVPLHILQGIDKDLIPEIAEGLNRSKQVDDPSLFNLQGDFDIIQKSLRGVKGAESIAYHQGDEGDTYISDVLAYLAMFNIMRFSDNKQPNNLYHKLSLGLRYYREDMRTNKDYMRALIAKLPDILWLRDSIKKAIPAAAKNNNFQFGRIKLGGQERAGGVSSVGSKLPFLGEETPYKVPNGWLYPILSAFRANIDWDPENKIISWKAPLNHILPDIIDELTGVCVAEHKNNNAKPEFVGKKESGYNQCYAKVQLYLAKKNLL